MADVAQAPTMMLPHDALKTIRRLRAVGPCKISLHVDSQLITEDGKHYAYPGILDNLTLEQAKAFLEDTERLRETLREISDATAMIPVKVHTDKNDERRKTVVLG